MGIVPALNTPRGKRARAEEGVKGRECPGADLMEPIFQRNIVTSLFGTSWKKTVLRFLFQAAYD